MVRVVKKNLESESQKIVLGKRNKPARKLLPEAVTEEASAERVKTLRGKAKPGSLVYRAFAHTERVAKHAASIFDTLLDVHGLAQEWRPRLLWAALLHDVGLIEGEKGHHKVSKKMILKDQSYPLSAIDRPFVALLARFHRKSMPTIKHRELMSLPREDRKKFLDVLSILRFCDGLDDHWKGSVTGLQVRREKNFLIFTLEGNEKVKKAFAHAKKKANRLFGCKLKLQKKKATQVTIDVKETKVDKAPEVRPAKSVKEKDTAKLEKK